MEYKNSTTFGNLKKVFHKEKPDFTAEFAWLETTYGKDTFRNLEQRVKDKQEYIKSQIKSKFPIHDERYTPSKTMGCYKCVVDIEEDLMCCVDEVLRGTNTIERISASAEILSSLAQQPIQIFAATHDMELTELLKNSYVNYHFSETLEGDDVKFSYKIQEGPADSRNAIRLLRALGYDPGIADRAEKRAERFMEAGNWEL